MTRPHPAWLATVGLVGALACVSTPAADPTDPVGCWYFERNEAAVALNLPWGVRLDSTELTGSPALEQRGGGRVAATLNPDGPAGHPFGYWLSVEGDSVELGYPAGGGLVVRLARGESVMSGSARAVGDVIRPGEGARAVHAVRLTRAQCPG